jgi:hypothetical protein
MPLHRRRFLALAAVALAAPAIAGAALLGLDDLGAGPEAQAQARAQLARAVPATRGEPLAAVTSEGPIDG